jgi:FAD/FMN-containing dehydrogenase
VGAARVPAWSHGPAPRRTDGLDRLRGLRRCPGKPRAQPTALLKLYEHYGYQASIYGHFGEGCIHNRLNLDLTSAPGIATYRSFAYQAAELVVAMGGSISGEHGDGQSRAELLPIMFGPEMMDAFGRFKDLWDPEGGMNPGMVVRAGRIDDHRRLAPVTNQP